MLEEEIIAFKKKLLELAALVEQTPLFFHQPSGCIFTKSRCNHQQKLLYSCHSRRLTNA